MFADDHEETRALVRDILQTSGYEVLAVPDGRGVIRSLEERAPDLLVLDLNMPGMSGLEVCRRIKANPFTAHVPVLMLTAQSEIEMKVEGYEAGADDYLAKPFDARELRARTAALLRLVRRESDRNPSTGLPGGRAIEEELARRVGTGRPFVVCYLDLDNFKAFADTFGFSQADHVIRDTGRVVLEAVGNAGAPGDFAGHIGGDDFVVVTDREHAQSIAEGAARGFRDVVAAVVGEARVERGKFTGLDRDGVECEFPIACLSAMVIEVDPAHWVSPAHLGAHAAELKRRAKRQGAGTMVVGAV